MTTQAALPIGPQPEGAQALVAAQPSMEHLMQLALEKGAVDALERLVALKERTEDRSAEAAFNRAITDFQQRCPPIRANKVSKQVSRDGTGGLPYADLDQIARTIGPVLRDCGLSYTFDTEEIDDKRVKTTCVVRHVEGHSRSGSITFPVESSGGMSAQQKVGSANTYGRRYALINALGLTTADADADGGDPALLEPIDAEQAGHLVDLIRALEAEEERFCDAMGVDVLGDITQGQWPRALKLLGDRAAREGRNDVAAKVAKLQGAS